LLIDAGVNPKAIQEFMGHATIEETFSRYGPSDAWRSRPSAEAG
jgi:hypothetical protein